MIRCPIWANRRNKKSLWTQNTMYRSHSSLTQPMVLHLKGIMNHPGCSPRWRAAAALEEARCVMGERPDFRKCAHVWLPEGPRLNPWKGEPLCQIYASFGQVPWLHQREHWVKTTHLSYVKSFLGLTDPFTVPPILPHSCTAPLKQIQYRKCEPPPCLLRALPLLGLPCSGGKVRRQHQKCDSYKEHWVLLLLGAATLEVSKVLKLPSCSDSL